MSVAVLVVSLSERHGLLKEALDSVAAQTLAPDDVVVGIDPRRLGEVANGNRLIDATDSEWIAFLHDDDVWRPDHLAIAMHHAEDADVIVSRFELVGRPCNTIDGWHDDFADLATTNWFPPSCVVARRSVFGHWTEPEPPERWIDWTAWRRLLAAGARFADTKTATCVYRFGEWGNGSWQPI